MEGRGELAERVTWCPEEHAPFLILSKKFLPVDSQNILSDVRLDRNDISLSITWLIKSDTPHSLVILRERGHKQSKEKKTVSETYVFRVMAL